MFVSQCDGGSHVCVYFFEVNHHTVLLNDKTASPLLKECAASTQTHQYDEMMRFIFNTQHI